jgi:hypothetical protein
MVFLSVDGLYKCDYTAGIFSVEMRTGEKVLLLR